MTYYNTNNNNNNNNIPAPVLKEAVEIFIGCRDLIKKDAQSNSDPFVVVYIKDGKRKHFTEIARTEVIEDNHNPDFSKQFRLDYYFEEEQVLRFDVYDEDKPNSKRLKDHDILGSCTIILGELVHESGSRMAKKLMHRGKNLKNKQTKRFSHLIATLEQVNQDGNKLLSMQFSCSGLPKMDGLFGKADPFFIMSRKREDGKEVNVFGDRTNYIKKTLAPTWKPFTVESQRLCNNDEYRPINIKIYDWDNDGSDDFIGQIATNLNELKTTPKKMPIKRPASTKKKKKKNNKTYGTFNVLQFKSENKSSFLDYMAGDVDLSLMVAIDFTGSNGHPRDQQSLHNIFSGQPSQYQSALRTIGNIVKVYDSDQKFPVWGFGAHFANLTIQGQRFNGVLHDFNLNFHPTNGEVYDVYGIEQTYLKAVGDGIFSLSGPTLFAPILAKAHRIAVESHRRVQSTLQYNILLIITDGIINDMKQTKDEIVAMANEGLPISIIIVGVGNADFSKMDELDGDDNGLMNSRGQPAKRDIVQFVAMNKFQVLSQLSKETLIEIPGQFLSYVRQHNIAPREKSAASYSANQFAMTDAQLQQQETTTTYTTTYGMPSATAPTQQVSDAYVNAPLPPGWEKAFDESGTPYFVDHNNGATSWVHPSSIQTFANNNN